MKMNKNKKLVIVGVTGLVGREMLKILESIDFPFDNIDGCASCNSAGKLLNYKDKQLIVKDIKSINFKNYNIALFSAGSEVSKVYAPIAVENGCTVIDNTSYFRMNNDVPLVVPEININSINSAKLIANPNCSTIQMVMPLKPLHDAFGLRELVISTYQASGGAGQKGINALLNETRKILNNNILNINNELKILNEIKEILNNNIFNTDNALEVLSKIKEVLNNNEQYQNSNENIFNTNDELKVLNKINEIVDNNISYKDNNSPFNKQLAFNVIPQIDRFDALDYTKEEWKMINETKKILELQNIDVTATCVRVPVIRGHAVSVFAKFNKTVDINIVKEVLNNFDGVTIIDDPYNQVYATPIDCANKDDVFVSRIRNHPTIDNGLSFWCVSDNVRKGAALNAIQIASLL